jgi:hypothetical protein
MRRRRVDDIKLVYETVGGMCLITSPDVPGLYVSAYTRDAALEAVPSALEMLDRMSERVENVKRFEEKRAVHA